jgi:putative membrane protein insertion efficiency factor
MSKAHKLMLRVFGLPQAGLILLIKAYRLLLSPSLGSACRFEPSCSAYGLEALERHGAVAGTGLTLWRLARCHPWCDGGHDPVPTPHKRTAFPLFSRWVTPVTPTLSKKKPS